MQKGGKMIKNNEENVVLSNILNLMKVKGVRQKDLAEFLGVSQNAITQWKMHKTKSYMKYLDRLSEYFNVSKDELLQADNKQIFESYLSKDEQQIIKQYRLLTPNLKRTVQTLLLNLNQN